MKSKHLSLNFALLLCEYPTYWFSATYSLGCWNKLCICHGEDGAVSTHLLFCLTIQCSDFCSHVMISLLQCMQFNRNSLEFLLLDGLLWYLWYLETQAFCPHFVGIFRFQIFVSCHLIVLVSDPHRENTLVCIWELPSSEYSRRQLRIPNKTCYYQDYSGYQCTLEQFRHPFCSPGLSAGDIWL